MARALCCLGAAATTFWPNGVQARLGETEAQTQARYGAPTPELASPLDQPLLAGAKTVIYHFGEWRVRVAFLKDAAARLEYVHLAESNAPKAVTEPEIKAVLDAEKAGYVWREVTPRSGYKELDALQAAGGRRWERSDRALAQLRLGLLLVLQTRDVEAYEKKLSQAPAGAIPATTPATPKF